MQDPNDSNTDNDTDLSTDVAWTTPSPSNQTPVGIPAALGLSQIAINNEAAKAAIVANGGVADNGILAPVTIYGYAADATNFSTS